MASLGSVDCLLPEAGKVYCRDTIDRTKGEPEWQPAKVFGIKVRRIASDGKVVCAATAVPDKDDAVSCYSTIKSGGWTRLPAATTRQAAPIVAAAPADVIRATDGRTTCTLSAPSTLTCVANDNAGVKRAAPNLGHRASVELKRLLINFASAEARYPGSAAVEPSRWTARRTAAR